jgi:hypothetical protein
MKLHRAMTGFRGTIHYDKSGVAAARDRTETCFSHCWRRPAGRGLPIERQQ